MLTSDALEAAAVDAPSATAWIFGDTVRSWAAADGRANRVANAMLARGLAPGDRVGILAHNSDQLAEAFFALPKAGLVAVPLNVRASPAEIRFIAERAQMSAFMVSPRLAKTFRDAALDTGALKLLVGFGADHGMPDDYEALVAAGAAGRPAHRAADTDLRIVKFTSGTTGAPKGCMGTHRECVFNVMAYLIAEPYAPDEVCGLVVSLGAGLGSYLLTAHVYRGAPTVILDTTSPAAILDAIARHRIARLTAVPTLIAALVDEQAARPRDLSSLRLIGYTGSPATIELIARGQAVLGCGFYQAYGATESGGRITHLSPADHRTVVATAAAQTDAWGRNVMPAGRALPGFAVRLADTDGRDVADGAVGELVVRGESIFKGYLDQPELNAEVLQDGWWRTGDLARRDANGWLYIVDRKKDMIVYGGYNVYSEQVEHALATHPAVAEVAVVGVPHPRWGESVCAFVVPRAGTTIDEAALDALCRESLAAYKVPRQYVMMDALPMTTTGKVRKTELRDRMSQAGVA